MATANDSTNYQTTNLSWKDELEELKKESDPTMKNLIEYNNATMTTTIKDSVNDSVKEFQTTLMKMLE